MTVVVNLLQRQIEHRATLVCENRNKGLPVGIGKAGFEPVTNGVKFIFSHYKLDSSHCDYAVPVARIQWEDASSHWVLSVPDEADNNIWIPYPYLERSVDLTALIREIEKDPKSFFWS
ncbi:hypothetical protein VA7868_03261 [Vibrio aerogenes CECT 7868]|uniref:DUF3024 domain-containing protein n=1 Tax=Vibrio aerogenes CECT 7868 TaxID=1216006 RepID=A0A1M5ZUU3_9VIBR|nr:DUF3024 domain-containing protein [Vibrio aerogenes]SHI27938.1 hypothetical protein VA7868_03261 [Vibrio aerogenes CECT 7868]